jgi:hypothetical protein
MGVLKDVADRILGGSITSLEEAVSVYGKQALLESANNGLLRERISELELSMEDAGWLRLSGDLAEGKEFSRDAIRNINKLSRLYWLKNPLIKRAVYTQTAYIFGQGMTLKAAHPSIQDVIDDLTDDEKNKTELFDHQARMTKETELQLLANLFFVFFVNESTGHVRIRTVDPDEITNIVTNPEDRKEPWYYLREWQQVKELGSETTEVHKLYYPDYRYNPQKGYPSAIDGVKVAKEQVYHVKVNCLSDMKFGVSEVYAGIDWAKAYKEFLEDWATIVKALSRFAWKVTSSVGQTGIDLAKSKLNSTVTSANPTERTMPPAAGSMWMSNDALKMEPITKSGATTSVEDGRRLLLMVSAATGIFEHYFGDPSTGNLATAKSMERPMELMFVDRQELWRSVHDTICQYAIDQAIIASSGPLKGEVEWNDYDERKVQIENDAADPQDKNSEGPQPIDRTVVITFPDILEKDMDGKIKAIVTSATLDGKQPAKTIDMKTVTKMLLDALGESDYSDLLDTLFPDDPIAWTEQAKIDDKAAAEKAKAFGLPAPGTTPPADTRPGAPSGAPAPVGTPPGPKPPTAKSEPPAPPVHESYIKAIEEVRDVVKSFLKE